VDRSDSVASDTSPREPEAALTNSARRPRRRLTLGLGGVVIVLVTALVVLLVVGLVRQKGSYGGFAVNAVGRIGRINRGPAPDFSTTLFTGETFRLADQRGQIVVVNFWASWCPPCRTEAPVLERAWQRYRGRGVQFIGLNVWDTDSDARNFMTQYGTDYPNGPDNSGRAAINYGVTGLPETFIIRPDGTIAQHWIGPLTDQQIDALLADAQR